MAIEAGATEDPADRFRRIITACLSAIDARDHTAARELAGCAEVLAASVGALAEIEAAVTAGAVDQATGDFTTAARAFAKAAGQAKRCQATADGIRLFLKATLGLAALHYAQGDHPQAEQILLDALATSASGSPEPGDLARLYSELSEISRWRGDLRQAADYNLIARGLLEVALPQSALELAAACRSMGILAHARGEYQAAEEPARRAVALREQALGSKHPDVAADRAALASVLLQLRRFDEAERLLHQALPVLDRADDPARHEHAIALGRLAIVAHRCGHHLTADVLYHRALNALEPDLGPTHPDLAPILAGIADLRRTFDNPTQARPGYSADPKRGVYVPSERGDARGPVPCAEREKGNGP